MFKEKKNILRLIGFILAVAAAVTAFTAGFLQLGHKEPGFYDVGMTAEGQTVMFDSGTHFMVYAQGSSSAIRQRLSSLQKVFTESLLYAYRLLDADHVYEGVVNIASLNHRQGEALEVGEVLYAVLTDAAARTERGEGYSMFAGPLYREWQTLRYLEEPEEADPLNNPAEAELLDALTAQINRKDAAKLDLSVPGMAKLTVSPEYLAATEEMELASPVLDLNLLHDAWMLVLTARALEGQGITEGYLYTESGCSLWLESGSGDFSLYTFAGDGPVNAGTADWSAPCAWCQFTALPLTEERYGYYTAKGMNRHPLIDTRSGAPQNLLLSASMGGGREDLPEIAYRTAVLCMCQDRAALYAAMETAPETMFCACVLREEPDRICAAARSAGLIKPEEGFAVLPAAPGQ